MKVRVVIMTENEVPAPSGADKDELQKKAKLAWETIVELFAAFLPEDETAFVECVEVL